MLSAPWIPASRRPAIASGRVRLLPLFGWGGLGTALVAAAALAAGQAPPSVSFGRSVQPLFAAKCVSCHGPTRQQNGLRLDDVRRTLQGGDNGPTVAPGKSNESLLIQRVTSADPKKRMPPGGVPLTAEELARLRAWIDAGAPAEPGIGPATPHPGARFWSFQAVRDPALPTVRTRNWARNPVDLFILEALERRSLKPSTSADRPTLLRRLSVDLLGLPPSPEEVDAFVRDTRPDAYERVVERLLASPHFGERWGRRWLDLARYADSNGYTIDSARTIWKYRDWVIDAINRDLPFDQFTIEQLAGDMLPQATQDQIIATGFHRNTLVNEEGGTDQEQFRVEAVVDRVNTTGAVWLGLTVGCAQCHTHKYDPITQREYYQLFALFNNADEPTLNFPNPEQAQRLAAFDAERKRTETELAEYERALRENQPAWEEIARRNLRVPWRLLDPDQFTAPAGMQLRKLADQSLLASGTVPENGNYTVTAPAGGRVTAVRLEVLTHPSLPSRGPGFVRGNFVLSEVELAAVGPDGQERKLVLDGAGADHSQTEYEVAMAVDGNAATGWAINVPAGMGRLNTDRTAVFLLQEPVELAAGSRLKITLKHEHPNRKYLIGRMRLAVAGAAREEVEFVVRPELRPLLLAESARRSAEEQKRVAEEYDRTDGRRARLRARLTGIEAQRKAFEKGVPSTLVLRERQEPRETFMHIRGDFLRKGSRVTPGVPEVLPPLPAAVTQPNRLDFVRWLVSDQNPLTPRVTVNRVWQALFGSGLVETENDFGKQGTAPTHPLLLDWLAARFRGRGLYTPAPARDRSGATAAPLPATNLGWSLKGLIRLLVTSATYRQASHARPDLVAVDPLNRLLGKQNRFRVEAEIIRDACLTASGLLSRKIGGPSVYPPAPANLDLFSQNKKNWEASPGEDRYRRGMYTFWWRSNPYAMFTTFDAPGATVTCTRRTRSNTPLGALMLANDAGLVEMARGLATRVMTDVSGSDEERVRYAFRRTLGREPTSVESRRLQQLYHEQTAAFQNDPRGAAEAAPKERPAAFDAAQAAGWTAVARVLLNLDEFITRE